VLGERLSPLAVAGLAVLAAGLVLLAWGARTRDPGPFAVEG
jgi:drug/metabolite transporter, DME family